MGGVRRGRWRGGATLIFGTGKNARGVESRDVALIKGTRGKFVTHF